MNLILDLQNASSVSAPPSLADFERWVGAALHGRRDEAEVSIRLVDEDEGAQLNAQYRQKDYATNVLSFPADLPPELGLPLLGDLVICAGVVQREAIEQGKPEIAHWAHMVIHGTLHLIGYDHIDDADAEVMEGLEIGILETLEFPNPYLAN
ncbi:putative rRNA maturation factor [Litorivivens lipolytica]|uniref:Endoribonuclease YbeY n=1 Tax=Litorivivens lipolytica TaxID=1524264 RepID=A0A7W4W3U8_9GAMM|nr:rRNA maturation RNase YbeY [Litorivivens lipolytica]MBB3046946.1 putative rRNA maturation factor [Litorivivens lipolytica]